MDLEAIWQAHKPFIIKVGVGALVFLIVNAYQGSVLTQANALSNSAGSAESDLMALVEELQGAEGREKGRAENLDERLEPAVLDAILWRADQDLRLPEGENSPLLYYTKSLQTALSRIKQAAANWSADVPRDAKGLDLATEVAEHEVPEALAQIDVVQRLVQRLLDAGVRTVQGINLGDPRYSPLEGLGGHLRALPIDVDFEANTRVLARVLAEVQVAGSFLELTGCEIQREGKGPVRVHLELQALSRVDAPPEGARTESQAAAPSRPRRGAGFGFQRER